ncbi:MAG: 23S rRNA (pseudouridine(1915)-N(3))-methyltransferase RlmH, partial [Gemmatimonas sp.]
MRVSLLCVGKPRQQSLAEAIQEYESRAARYWPLDVVEVREESARALLPEQVKDREAERLLDRVPLDAMIVACDPGGESMTSEAFSAWLSGMRDRAQSVALVIGGAYGLGEVVRTKARKKLSLAPWVLPHELAR